MPPFAFGAVTVEDAAQLRRQTDDLRLTALFSGGLTTSPILTNVHAVNPLVNLGHVAAGQPWFANRTRIRSRCGASRSARTESEECVNRERFWPT